MGVIQVPGNRSGQLYSVQIDGDVPTDSEYARIADYVRQQEASFAQRYAESFGEELEAPDDGTAIGRGIARGRKQIKQAVGETLGTAGEQSGLGFLETYGTGLEERARQELGELQLQQPRRMQSTDVEGLGSALTYAGEIVGEQIPQLGLGLGAAAAAPLVAGATGIGGAALGIGAAAATTAPILFGNNIQRQEDEVAAGKKASVDVGDALVATFGQATLEGISDKLLLGGVLKPLSKSLFTRVGSRAVGGAATESLTEVGQQMMERAQAGLPIDSDDAIAEYREAAIAGGLLGGGVRATGIGERSEAPVAPPADPEATPETPATPEATPEAAAEVTPEDVAAVSDADIAEVAPEVTPEVTPEPTVEAAPEAQPVTAEMLDTLGVLKPAAMRKGANSVIGKDLSDPVVQEKLRKYAKNPNTLKRVPDMADRVEALLGGKDAATPRPEGFRPEPESDGAGVSVPSGTGSVGLDGQLASADVGTAGTTAPDGGPVGVSVPSPELPAVPAGVESDAVDAAPEPAPGEVTPEQVAEVEQATDAIVAEPVTPAPQAPAPQATTPAAAPVATPAMEQAATPGQVTGTAQQAVPAPVPPAPRRAPVQGAAAPKTDLQAVEDERNVAAQAEIERVFEGNRGKQPEVREYHDTQLDPRDVAEVTTAVDKEGVVELLNTKDADLGPDGKAAKLYFKRFRRPVDALAEIGATVVVGPTQTIKKDYTPKQFAFYKGMTQKSAMNARRWVHDNMSDGAIQEMIRARRVANRDTAKFNPSDAYIGVTKALKSIQQKEDNAYKTQLNAFLASPEANFQAPAKPDQSLREDARGELVGERSTGPVTKTFRPKKGKTAFESWMDGIYSPQEQKALTDQEMLQLMDDFAYSQSELGFLLTDPVHGLDMALLPSVRNAVQRGDLQFALNAIASTSQVDRIRQIAGKLAEVVGTTRVQVVDDLSEMTGRKAAGLFEPETNTIFVDATNGMNVHTILHEMTHAATSAALANPALPEVQQLRTLFNSVREQIGEVYGTANLDEFVAEAFSNPEFQSALALTRVDGGKMSGWDKFTGAVRRVVRKLLGMSPKNPESALDEVDRIVNGMLAPSPDTRAAPSMMLLSRTKQGANALAQRAANLAPETSSKVADLADAVYNEGVAPKVKSFILNTLPVNILTDIASKRIPFAENLNLLIKQQSGALREKSDVLDAMLRDLHTWQRKNKAAAKILNNIIPRSTYLKVDPSRTDAKYMAEIRKDSERSAEYDALRAEFLKMDKKGQGLYQQIRNYFQDTYDDIVAALESRLDATVPDAAARKTAFEQLRKILEKDSGRIRPYFPLMRKGKYRLEYTVTDPDTGQPDYVVEYFPTLRVAEKAKDMVNADADAELVGLSESATPMSFDKVPSTGFVRDILQSVQFNEDRFKSDADYKKTMQELVDLALDAMPERSFMQSLRRRKGVRGFLGDDTVTGALSGEFDAFTMMKEKGRDLNRQLVQMKSAAEIEKFRKELTPYKTDPSTAMVANKLDRIAVFAQSPNVPQYSQVVNSLGFGFTMGLNFSSAAITFFDVAMSAMPVLAGSYGVGNTSRAFGTATKMLAGAPSKRNVTVKGPDGQPQEQEVDMGTAGKSIANYDLASMPQALKRVRADILIAMGIDQGQFNQSMVQEDLEVGRGAPLETVNKYSSFLFHHSERFNRETTLTAAYMLEVDKLQKAKGQLSEQDYRDAAQEAINQTEFTLGSTAAAGRPIIAQSGIGNILFLFKRFAVSKYYMMAKLAKDAANHPDPEVRKAARAGGRNFLISTGLFAGMGGMPLMGAIGAIYDLFTDDDEDDFKSALRKYVGEGVSGGLANEILGVDVANRISMNSLLYRAPIIDKDQSELWTLIEQLGGPVVGVGLSVERGIKEVAEGEVYRGVEAMVPASIRNGMKAFRFATEGAETRRGDAITEDINPYNVVLQGLGFAPQGYIQQLEANKNVRRRADAISSRRTKLLRRRNMAIREGDMDEVAKVDRLIAEFNEGLPQDADTRKRRITSETKKQSLRTFGRTTDNMRGGITTTPFERSILEQYDF